MNPPTPYDGSRQNGEGFIKACCLYLQLNVGWFPDDAAVIGWTLSYMTMGRAQVWRDAVIDHYTNHQKYPWANMKAFIAAFNMEFLPVAEAKVEGHTYFQKANESTDTYINGFRDLVKKASLMDVTSIVIKFRWGLQDSLARTLTNSRDPPSATNIKDWYRQTHKLEHSRTIQQTISGTRSAMPPMHPHFLTALRQDHTVTPPTTTPHMSAINPNPTVPPTSAPMDVDAAQTH